jgi:hypothetical protein
MVLVCVKSRRPLDRRRISNSGRQSSFIVYEWLPKCSYFLSSTAFVTLIISHFGISARKIILLLIFGITFGLVTIFIYKTFHLLRYSAL